MKKLYYLAFLLLVAGTLKVSAQAFNIFAYNANLCTNSSAYAVITSTQPGATSYTWMIAPSSGTCAPILSPGPNGAYVTIYYPCCGPYTITCQPYSSGSPVGSPVSSAVSVTCTSMPTVTFSPLSSPVCAGSFQLMFAAGASSYSWFPGSVMSSSYTPPMTAGLQTVNVIASSGQCTSSYILSYSVMPVFNFTAASATVCAGSSATLSTNASSIQISPGNFTTAVVAPSVNTTYTLFCPSSTYACKTQSTVLVTVNPWPIVTAAATTQTLCSGNSTTLFASGASTYGWSNGIAGPMTVVSPTASMCYSVLGTDANGCSNIASVCLTVQSASLSVSMAQSVVCAGTSNQFTANGATSYTWSTTPPVYTNTASIIQNHPSPVLLTGIDANGCPGSTFFTPPVDTTCNMVWPGDANSDGVVSTLDVLELGLYNSNTGWIRSGASNSYVAQHASVWTGTGSNGQNQCHVDCDGSGTVNAADTLAIYNNFSLTHTFRRAAVEGTNGDISIVLPATLKEGDWNVADIVLVSSSTKTASVYGLAFDLGFDPSKIDNGQIYVTYPTSFMNPTGNNIRFRKVNMGSGMVYCATVKTDKNDVSGSGKIGEVHFKLAAGTANSQVAFSISNTIKVDKGAVKTSLDNASASGNIVNGINVLSAENTQVIMYPNPASGNVTLRCDGNKHVDYIIADLSGRIVNKGSFSGEVTINTTGLVQGTYIVTAITGGQRSFQKLIIQ